MQTCKDISLILMLLLLCALSINAHAGSVHKWVDAQGVTHYSDQLPESSLNTKYDSVKQIDVLDSYSRSGSNSDVQDDYYSVTNQWARMREERIARKQLQLEKAKNKAMQQPVVPQVVYVNQVEEERPRKYYPAYGAAYGLGHRGYGHNYYKKRNHYSGRRNNASCRLPNAFYSRGNSRFSSSRLGLGLTLSIR